MQGSDTSPVQEGDVLAGKYRVDRVLGVGGMGVVVAATHMQLDQKVALKFLLPWALENEQAVERFSREARAAVRLKSDHVARVLDVGTLETGSPYIVMEFLEGIDLGDLIHRPGHRIRIDEAVDYLLQACDAVAEAHAIGIVHRDLKPRNLFLTTGNDGNPLVKVLDFGISKINGPGGDLSLTRTTEIIGSPNYMSPEQLRASRDVDERTDIWALGVILYELLGGEVPFVAETLTQLTAMVITEPPRPLAEVRPDAPFGLAQAISVCLEKDPARRFSSVADLAMALDKYAPEHSRGLAKRVRRVADASRPGGAPSAVLGSSGRRPMATSQSGEARATGGTSVSWGKTELATDPPPPAPAPIAAPPAGGGWRLPATIFSVVLAAGLAATVVFIATRPRPVSGSPGEPVATGEAPPPAVTSTVAGGATSNPGVAAPPATGQPGDPGATTASPVAAATTSQPTVKPSGRHGGKTAAKDAGAAAAPPSSGDDMPVDRH